MSLGSDTPGGSPEGIGGSDPGGGFADGGGDLSNFSRNTQDFEVAVDETNLSNVGIDAAKGMADDVWSGLSFMEKVSYAWDNRSFISTTIGKRLSNLPSPIAQAIIRAVSGIQSISAALDDGFLSREQAKTATDFTEGIDRDGVGEIEKLMNDASGNIPPVVGGGDTSGSTVPGEFSYNQNERTLYNDFVNQWLDNALDSYTVRGTSISDAVDKANTGLETYMANLTDDLGLFKETTRGATEEQGRLLSGLQEDISSGLNLEPFNFSLLGQDVSFIPGANRRTAQQLAGLGQTGLENITGSEKDIFDASSSTFQNLSNAEKDQLLNSIIQAETGDGTLDFLKDFKGLAELEASNIATDKGIDISQQKIEQDEPGLLDKIKGISTLFSSGGDLYKSLFG